MFKTQITDVFIKKNLDNLNINNMSKQAQANTNK